MRVAVIVLGDLGRSPRMQYHALALAVNGVDVDLIGEQGLPLPPSLAHPRITVHRLRQHRVASIGRTPFVIRGGWEALSAAVDALRCLFRVAAPDAIVTQTPPAVPTLVVAWIASRCRGARLVFDWHNLAWTLLAARPGTSRLVIGLARAYERRAATLADAHLCVSSAAATFLTGEWALSPVHVLRDRPAEIFAPQAASAEMRRRLARLAGLDESTRPALALSPTGFTRDEDLDLILAAADDLEARWREAGPAGGLVIAVSGEGPGRKAFERRLEARTGRRVWVVPTWVAAEEYPSLVASADVGVCVHRSSSCVDLPMKIADLFGSGVPVCALDYGDALREMVTPGQNGLLFRDGRELAGCLDALFRQWPVESPTLARLRAGAREASAGRRWTDGWQSEGMPVILPPTTAGPVSYARA